MASSGPMTESNSTVLPVRRLQRSSFRNLDVAHVHQLRQRMDAIDVDDGRRSAERPRFPRVARRQGAEEQRIGLRQLCRLAAIVDDQVVGAGRGLIAMYVRPPGSSARQT